MDSGALTGLPRGLAFRLIEAGGVIPRAEVERDLAALSQHERRTVKTFAIRIGAHSVWLTGALKPRARLLAQAFVTEPFRPGGEALLPLPSPAPSPRALAAFGRRAVVPWSAPVETLERFAELSRAAGKAPLPLEALSELGWTAEQARQVQAALRLPRADKAPRPGQPTAPPKDSPFAALAQLTQPPAPPRRKRRPRRKAASA
ncbi:hypothetical protein D3C80_1450080 [compost metagenome]